MLNSTFSPANTHGPPEAISNALISICAIIPYEIIFMVIMYYFSHFHSFCGSFLRRLSCYPLYRGR